VVRLDDPTLTTSVRTGGNARIRSLLCGRTPGATAQSKEEDIPRTVLGTLVVTLAAGFLAVAPPARAAFPGSNGRIVFESGRTDEFDIYSMNADGTGLTRLTHGIREDHAPSWSPDGTRIVFYRSAEGLPGDLWVMDADGSNLHRLTSGKADDEDPTWSPDGTNVVFWRATAKRAADVFVVNAEGGRPTRLTTDPAADVAPAWSSSGKIAFTSYRSGNGDLYVMNDDGTGVTRLTTDARQDLDPDWSPDGSRIAFFERKVSPDSDEVYVIGADGSGRVRLTRNHAADSYPAWSPNGHLIAFTSSRNKGFFDIWRMRPNGKGVRPLTHDGFVDGLPDWQPA
jgi:TolB protein